ncbi:MAG: hypothetical protein AB7F35_10180, partial [Acetobacteraceae bacterium]
MPRYVLHVGPHKTGSTYLQTAVTRLRLKLLERGIAYPESWGSIHGQYPLVERMRAGTDDKLRAEFAALNRSDLNVVLLSSEIFSTLPDERLQALHELMEGNPVTVVFYCRRWAEVLPSAWRESVKHREMLTFPEYLTRYVLNPDISPVVNHAIDLSRYARIFGPKSLRLVSYNHLASAGGDLFGHFCRTFLDWPDPPKVEVGRVNQSLSLVDSETLRALNAFSWNLPMPERPVLLYRYMGMKESLPLAPVFDLMRKSVHSALISEDSQTMRAIHQDILGRFGAGLVEPCPGRTLFTP